MAASESQTTTDHDEIRRWVEEHDGKPASVKDTERDDEAGVLRIASNLAFTVRTARSSSS